MSKRNRPLPKPRNLQSPISVINYAISLLSRSDSWGRNMIGIDKNNNSVFPRNKNLVRTDIFGALQRSTKRLDTLDTCITLVEKAYREKSCAKSSIDIFDINDKKLRDRRDAIRLLEKARKIHDSAKSKV